MYTCMVKLRSWLYYIFSIAVNNTYGKEVGVLYLEISVNHQNVRPAYVHLDGLDSSSIPIWNLSQS